MTLQEIFYVIKPLIPRSLQIALRRQLSKRKRALYANVWPIDEQAGTPPVWWEGWPDNKKFAIVLTHDVEKPKGFDRCYKVSELEERYGFRSSFNFVAEGYGVSSEVRRYLIKKGFEIGLHGIKHNRNLYASKRIFQKQVGKINHYLKEWDVVGFRTPCMYHNLAWINDLNLEYDCSTFDTDPFEPQPDGIETIFPLWIQGDGAKGYVELPYTVPQDFALFIILKETSINIWKQKVDWVAEHGGMVLVNTHPDYMNFSRERMTIEEYPARYYEEFLQYIRDKYDGQYWHVLPKEMARHWVSNFVDKEKERPRRNINKIRVCMVAHSFYEHDNRIKRYAEALAARGDDVSVIALKKGGFPYHEILNGVKIYRIGNKTGDEKGKFTYLYRLIEFTFLSAVYLTVKYIRTPFQLIHVHNVPDFLVFSALLTKLRGAKVILDCHDIVPEFYASKFKDTGKSFLFKALVLVEKMSAAFSDHVIVSNHLWEKTLLSRSVKEGKCTVIMNYPDQNVFYRRSRTRNDNKFIMLYPGTFNWHQGLDIAIKAFNLIKDKAPEAELHLYGSGNAQNSLQALINELGLQGRVLLEDPLPIEEVADIMANGDLGIVPKRNDPFGGTAFSTKVLEFMALGIPVIVSDTKIDTYYFNDSLVKFFKAGDENDLAESMLAMIRDKGLRERLSQNALKFIEDYTWETKQAMYLDLVDRLTEKNNRP